MSDNAAFQQVMRLINEALLDEQSRQRCEAMPTDSPSCGPWFEEQSSAHGDLVVKRLEDALRSHHAFARDTDGDTACHTAKMAFSSFLQACQNDTESVRAISVVQQSVPEWIECDVITCRVLQLLTRLLHYTDETVLRQIEIKGNAISVVFVCHQFLGSATLVSAINDFFQMDDPSQLIDHFHVDGNTVFGQHLADYAYLCRETWGLLQLTSCRLFVELLEPSTLCAAPVMGFRVMLPQQQQLDMQSHIISAREEPRVWFVDACLERSVIAWTRTLVEFPLNVTMSEVEFIDAVKSGDGTGVHAATLVNAHRVSLLDHPDFSRIASSTVVHADSRIGCWTPEYAITGELVWMADYQRQVLYQRALCSQAIRLPKKTIKVLYVEDNAIFTSYVRHIFKHFNTKAEQGGLRLQLDIVESSSEALAALSRNQGIDLVLVDHGLREGSGVHFMKKRPKDKCNIPCVLFSCHMTIGRHYRSYDFVDFILKTDERPLIPRLLNAVAQNTGSL